jgi:hypothetical protein
MPRVKCCLIPVRHGVFAAVAMASAACALAPAALAHGGSRHGHHPRPARLVPGNLLISRSVFTPADITAGVTQLPPGCTGSNCATAIADGNYPETFNNDTVDGSFGITSKIYLDQVTPWGQPVSTIPVPSDDITTSFSSKSELALNLSTNDRDLTFMGYDAAPGSIDVSNSNTPLVVDPTNPVPGTDYRVVAAMSDRGRFHFTLTNAYSGNNGRAAILNNLGHVFYTAGNAGNGSGTQPTGVVLGAGAQIMTPSREPESDQTPGLPTPVGNFNISQLKLKPDKLGKDDNFRGLTVFDNVLYYTKGSGSNGIDTVYFVDTTGNACPDGVGLPAANATLPTAPFTFDPTTGLPTNMCILQGFNTTVAKSTTDIFPFGLWFANAKTLYVADEGDGTNTYSTSTGTYTDAAAQTMAGLQKWTFDSTTGSWQLAYTLQSGLKLGQPYTVRGYPAGDNGVTGLPWAPATDGLRNITGRVNRDGTVTIWAVTSTVSGGGDQGADPNQVVLISDRLGSTSLPSSERFHTFSPPRYGQVVRGVSLTPGSSSAGRPSPRGGQN